MERSKKYDTVKEYYDNGLWKKSRVVAAVGKWITGEEYELITGEEFPLNNDET